MKKLLLLSAACAALLPFTAHADVVVHDAEAYETAEGMKVGAALMGLHSNIDDKLVGATTPVAAKVEIHSMTDDNGIMKMRKVESLDLPAQQTTKLTASGYHLMLIGLKDPLKAGQEFPIILDFENASDVVAKVKVLSRSDLEKTLEGGEAKTPDKHHDH